MKCIYNSAFNWVIALKKRFIIMRCHFFLSLNSFNALITLIMNAVDAWLIDALKPLTPSAMKRKEHYIPVKILKEKNGSLWIFIK